MLSAVYKNTHRTHAHTHTANRRNIIDSGVNLTVQFQPSLSIRPATLHHDVVRQFHRRQNTMWKRIYYIYQNYKLYNCTTTVQTAQMCTCASLIYRYYVPVTLLFILFYLFILILLLFVKRGTTKWKRLYIIMINIIIFDFLHRCAHWWKKTVAHSPEHILRAVFSVHWTALKCAEVWRCL